MRARILQLTRVVRTLPVGLLLIFLSACQVQNVHHDPVAAVSDANRFLKALYLQRDYSKALELADVQLRQSSNADDLRPIVERIKGERGELKALKADSYLMTPGRTMELFYIGTYERGTLYHRLVLAGDVPSGYRVSGVWYSVDPYPEQPMRRSFNQDLFVQ